MLKSEGCSVGLVHACGFNCSSSCCPFLVSSSKNIEENTVHACGINDSSSCCPLPIYATKINDVNIVGGFGQVHTDSFLHAAKMLEFGQHGFNVQASSEAILAAGEQFDVADVVAATWSSITEQSSPVLAIGASLASLALCWVRIVFHVFSLTLFLNAIMELIVAL